MTFSKLNFSTFSPFSASFVNHLSLGVNGVARITLVILPALAAANSLTQLGGKALQGGFSSASSFISSKLGGNVNGQKDKYSNLKSLIPSDLKRWASKAYHTSFNTLVTRFFLSTLTTIVSTYVLNKFLGPMPEIYNNLAKWSFSPIRFDKDYDVIGSLIRSFS